MTSGDQSALPGTDEVSTSKSADLVAVTISEIIRIMNQRLSLDLTGSVRLVMAH
ncbi:hypothetical protein [Albimonas donghaensis]|uniref:hypothetical protein n=1 Tax=Albimonas donghaensis TaxID=356660 RepID=UPI0015A2F4B2|nr:hypothetical protein [Albimonas donghaensis]